MRFQVSQVMDAIERRLTTDVTGAQAVVDLGEVARLVELDGGRPVNVVRIGMVIDALSRYLLDEGALLYGVAARALLSESALTSKERMVLSRWADDGLIEVTPEVGDRAMEVADLTGVPLIALRPYPEQAKRYAWLGDGTGRLLRLAPRNGVAVLTPMDGTVDPAPDGATGSGTPTGQAIGRAKVPAREDSAAAAGNEQPEDTESEDTERTAAAGDATDAEAAESSAETKKPEPEPEPEPEPGEESGQNAESEPGEEAVGALPLPVEVFSDHSPTRVGRVRVSRHRYRRAEPNGAYASVTARQWRCDGFECPAFGEHRRIGQPVPRLRDDVPVCPRHDEPVTDAGPRPSAYAVSIVVDDLPRQRLVVRGDQPVPVGRADDDPDVTSVARWLHKAAADWVSPVHLRLEAQDDGLVVTDLSDHGTVVWQRAGPDDPGTTRPLHRESYTLGEWDSVQLYTGIELVRGDRRLAAIVGRDEPASVLVDAPTAAHRQLAS